MKEALSGDDVAKMLGSAALVVVADDISALKAMVSWPLVFHLNGLTRMRRWAEVSGLPKAELKRVEPILMGHGICRLDGSVDELGIAVAQGKIAKEAGVTKR